MTQRTPLYDTHVAAGAKIVDFVGWDMPLYYGSKIDEHLAVRRDLAMIAVQGPQERGKFWAALCRPAVRSANRSAVFRQRNGVN